MQTNTRKNPIWGAIGISLLFIFDSYNIAVGQAWLSPPTMDEPADVLLRRNEGRQTIYLTGISDNDWWRQSITVTASISSDAAGIIQNLVVNYESDDPTGEITFDPAANTSGRATIIISVQDPDGTTNYDALVVVNAAPEIEIPDQEIKEGEAFTLDLDDFVNDPDTGDDLITWSAVGNSALSVNIDPATRVVTITPPNEEWSGAETIQFTANDNDETFPGEDSYDALFTVLQINDAPVLSGIEDDALSYTEGDAPLTITSQIMVRDKDDNEISSATVSVISNFTAAEDVLSFTTPNNTNIRGNYNERTGVLEFSGEASLDDYRDILRSITYHNTNEASANTSTRTIAFVVDDGESESTTLSRDIDIISNNDPPVITSTPVESVVAETEYLYEIEASDPNEGDEITFTATTIPGWLSLTDNGNGTAVLSGTPSNDQAGEYDVVITATDGENATAGQNFSIEVIGKNYAPFFASIPDTAGFATLEYNYEIIVEDENPDDEIDITLLSPIPQGLMFTDHGNRTATLAGTPSEKAVGDFDIIIRAADSRDSIAEQSFTLSILPLSRALAIINIEPENGVYDFGKPSFNVTDSLEIRNFITTTITHAVVTISDNYEPGVDSLSVKADGLITTELNNQKLILSGTEQTIVYQDALRSVRYYHKDGGHAGPPEPRTITFQVFIGSDNDINYKSEINSLSTRIIQFEPVVTDFDSLKIYNGFTPNGDGDNDTWVIENSDKYDLSEELVQVFTRSGKIVFESNSLQEEWDGTWEGDPLPSGVYFYYIYLNKSGATRSYKGTVAILK